MVITHDDALIEDLRSALKEWDKYDPFISDAKAMKQAVAVIDAARAVLPFIADARRKGMEDMRERAVAECKRQSEAFLSPQYAFNQPIGSLTERFACDECATAIRSLPLSADEKEARG